MNDNFPTESIFVVRYLLVSTCHVQKMNFALVFIMSTNNFFLLAQLATDFLRGSLTDDSMSAVALTAEISKSLLSES